MKHVRFAVMAEGFLRETVIAWPALRSVEGQNVVLTALLPLAGGTKPVQRSGFGPRLTYVVGGSGAGGERLSAVELYDPQAASWNQLAGMAGPRYAHGCVAFDGKLYAVGGLGAGYQELDTAEVYDPQTDG